MFTVEQINGWLADDLQKNHPSLLPATITDPRVAIENNQLMLGFRWQQPKWSVVVSLAAEVYSANRTSWLCGFARCGLAGCRCR